MYISRCARIADFTGELIFDFRSRIKLGFFSCPCPHGICDIHIRDRPVHGDSARCAAPFDRHDDIFLRSRVEDDPRTAVRLLFAVHVSSGLLHSDGRHRGHRLQISQIVDDRVNDIFFNDRSCCTALGSTRLFICAGCHHLVLRIKDSCHGDGAVRGHARRSPRVLCLRCSYVLTFLCACDCPHDIPALCTGCQTCKSVALRSLCTEGHYEHFLVERGCHIDISARRDSRSFSEKRLDASCRVKEYDHALRAVSHLFGNRLDRDEAARRFRFNMYIALRSDLDLFGLDDCRRFGSHDIHDCRDRSGKSVCVRSRHTDQLLDRTCLERYVSLAAPDLRINSCLREHGRSRINVTVVSACRLSPGLIAARRDKRVFIIIDRRFDRRSGSALDDDACPDLRKDVIRIREYDDRAAAKHVK